MTDAAAPTADSTTQARDLAEQALDKLVAGDESGADALLDKSRALDPAVAEGLVAELDEDSAGPGDDEDELDEEELDEDEEDDLDDEDEDEDVDEEPAEAEDEDEDA